MKLTELWKPNTLPRGDFPCQKYIAKEGMNIFKS